MITESFMVLDAAGRVLALRKNTVDVFPDALREPTNADLIELLARYEPAPPGPDDCGARDWSNLDQRMHYISHLFRAFHLERERFSTRRSRRSRSPSISSGVVPDGEL